MKYIPFAKFFRVSQCISCISLISFLMILLTIFATPPLAAQDNTACISVVGDSIAAGTLVIQVPTVGYSVLQTLPLSNMLADELAFRQIEGIAVRDRSVPAAYLSPSSSAPYRNTEAYRQLMDDGCMTTVVFPWNNDLGLSRDDAPSAHVDDLAQLLGDLRATNPEMQVIFFSHFWIDPQPFVDGYGVGISYDRYAQHHRAFMAACAPGGTLGQAGNIRCINSQLLLTRTPDPGQNVLLGMNQFALDALAYPSLDQESADLSSYYFTSNPGGVVWGDGVHLSPRGKAILIRATVDVMR